MPRFVLSPVLGVGLVLALVCPESGSVESRPPASCKRQSAGAETERALRQRGAERGAETERAAGRVSEEGREEREGREREGSERQGSGDFTNRMDACCGKYVQRVEEKGVCRVH